MMTHPMTLDDIEREAPLSALDIDVANASIRRLKIALLTTEQEKERMRSALFLLLQAIDDSNAQIIDSKLLNAGITQAQEILAGTEPK